MVGLVFAPHPCALNKKCLSFYDVQIILLPFFEIFAPFGSTKKHSSLPLQIDLSTPCLIQGWIALKCLKVVVIQGLIATKGLKPKGFLGNLRISVKENEKKKKNTIN